MKVLKYIDESTVGTLLITSRQYLGSSIGKMSNIQQIYNGYKYFDNHISDFTNNNGYHRVVGELIQVHQQLGGNGLNYLNGVEYEVYNTTGNVVTQTTRLPRVVFNEYVENGSQATFMNYEGHHINSQQNFESLTYDSNNLVLVTSDTHDSIANNPRSTPLATMNYSTQINSAYLLSIFGLWFNVLIRSALYGFVFVFLLHIILSLKRMDNSTPTTLLQKIKMLDYSSHLKSSLVGSGFAVIINTFFYWFTLLIVAVTNLPLNSFSGQVVLLLIIWLVYFGSQFVKNKGKNLKTYLVSSLKLFMTVVLFSLPSLIFSNILPVIGFAINMLIALLLYSSHDQDDALAS